MDVEGVRWQIYRIPIPSTMLLIRQGLDLPKRYGITVVKVLDFQLSIGNCFCRVPS